MTLSLPYISCHNLKHFAILLVKIKPINHILIYVHSVSNRPFHFQADIVWFASRLLVGFSWK